MSLKKSNTKKVKRKSSRHSSGSRKRKIKNFKDFRRMFFERLGMVSFITILFLLAMIFLVWRWQNLNVAPSQETVSIVDREYEEKKAFVTAIAPVAQRLQRQYGIFASVSMAQAMVESDFGRSGLADKYYNLFGVKTDKDDPMGVDLKTSEYIDNKWVEIVDRFKVYNSWGESMEAHAKLLVNGTSWDSDYYQAVRDGKTPQDQAQGLQSSGYATDPDYANKLINIMEEWDLYQYNQPIAEETTSVIEQTATEAN